MRLTFIAGALAATIASTAARSETVFGLFGDAGIVRFDSTDATVFSTATITSGLGGDRLIGIDFRPRTGDLYGLAQDGDLYILTPNADFSDFTATLASTLATVPNSGLIGIDFNPVPDRLRIQALSRQNLRADVDTGATTIDTPLTRVDGTRPQIVGTAYTNSVPGTVTSTQLFAIDTFDDTLGFLASPNNGVITTIGSLGISVGNFRVGFDIGGFSGIAYLNADGGFYAVDLGTGEATFLFDAPVANLRDISIAAIPEASTWAMMIVGFGLVGIAARRRSTRLTTVRA